MSIELCSSCGQSPVEYSRKLSQTDTDNITKPKNISTDALAQTPIINTSRILDISV